MAATGKRGGVTGGMVGNPQHKVGEGDPQDEPGGLTTPNIKLGAFGFILRNFVY